MSMLAAPRRKQRVINLRAKNSAWSDDPNKFGQRMLEKMGWSSGKGLGAKENGMVEHIVARYKNDDAGLGYEDKNDQWTKHEDDFNALLADLSNGGAEKEKLHSGVSLEDKSKRSKARVHYHKFTRGKDLTKYSEKDLANIFGKKSLKNEEKTLENITKEVETKEQIFTDKGSMEDYFKSKLAALKTKNKSSILNSDTYNDNEVDYAFRGFSGTADNIENNEENSCPGSFSFYGFHQSQTSEKAASPARENINDPSKKKKKKKEKNQNNESDNNCIENENINSEIVDNVEPEQPKKKKKKSKGDKVPNIEIDTEQNGEDNICSNMNIQKEKIKKSKKKKYSDIVAEENEALPATNLPESTENQDEDYVPKKKKKRKNKNTDE